MTSTSAPANCLQTPSKRAGLAAVFGAVLAVWTASAGEPSRFPTVNAEHKHARLLLENAMHYVGPGNKIVDPVSGYPFEGWNQDPSKGLFLRSFTQLTAIGQYMELLANVVAGYADSPDLSRDRALRELSHLVASLRRDQRDPSLGAKGLLVNFLDLATGKRLGPLASDVQKKSILDAFGPGRGAAIWTALQAKGWIVSRNKDLEAEIHRVDKYGYEYFDGPLGPFHDEATRQKVMAILDQRVVLVVFGDNANLSTSAAKTIGALLIPELAGSPAIAKIRADLEAFLDDQRAGYEHLYDPKVGLFDFGWDATKDRLFGWDDPQGNWTIGHMDYFVNEFRGPATFVAARFGLPPAAIGNLGFKMKPYTARDGRVIYSLAPWEGSAFQVLGLGLSLGEAERPSWRELLRGFVEIEIDNSSRRGLPGFLSESYTGVGVQYTGAVGIAEIAVTPKPRLGDAASLYCLGVAYSVAPEKVERFLGPSWPVISSVLTDHGPWEGYNVSKREPIRFQTSAHTLSLILGMLGTGSGSLKRYADHAGLSGRFDAYFPKGEKTNLLSRETQVFAWTNKDARISHSREGEAFHVRGDGVKGLGIAFVSERGEGVNLSGCQLTLRYRSDATMDPIIIALKPAGGASSAGLISKEIFSWIEDTGGQEREIRITLPATVGLIKTKEVVITHEPWPTARPIHFAVTRLDATPIAPGP
jgi:hypothetical protein